MSHRRSARLTKSEQEQVVLLNKRGYSRKETAKKLHITQHQVKHAVERGRREGTLGVARRGRRRLYETPILKDIATDVDSREDTHTQLSTAEYNQMVRVSEPVCL